MRPSLVALSLVLLAFPRVARGATIHVPGDQPTIQAGVDAAVAGDTVLLADGTYTGLGNRDIEITEKAITVASLNGPANCILDCGSTSTEFHRGFLVRKGDDAFTVIKGMTIRNAAARDSIVPELSARVGGGIACLDSAWLRVTGCVFEFCKANLGGGIGGNRIRLEIDSCEFNHNSAAGGGIRLYQNELLRITNTSAYDNTSKSSAGFAWVDGGNVYVEKCRFKWNGTDTGYGLWRGTCDSIWFSECYLDSNGVNGSVLMGLSMHYAEFTDCTFKDNFTSYYFETFGFDGPTSLTRCTFIGNYAKNFGSSCGALIEATSDLLVTECTFAGQEFSAPLFHVLGNTQLKNCLIAFNQFYCRAPRPRSLFSASLDSCEYLAPICTLLIRVEPTASLSIECTNIYGNWIGDWDSTLSSYYGIDGNISRDPLFCDPAAGDYSLQFASPCQPDSTGCGLMGALPVACGGDILEACFLEDETASHVIRHGPVLAWSRGIDFPQFEYELEVGSDSDWITAEIWQPGAAVSTDSFVTYTGLPLLDGQPYYSRVRIGNGTLWSYWIQSSFRMNSEPSPPSQIAPLDTAMLATNVPVFKATCGMDAEDDSQQVQFTVGYVLDTPLVAQSAYLPPTPAVYGDTVSWQVSVSLEENRLHSWTVRANDGYEASAASTRQFFYVNAVQESPLPSQLLGPKGNEIIYTHHPGYLWGHAADPDPGDVVSYDFRASTDSAFAFLYSADSLSDTAFVDTIMLDHTRRYWWKIVSRDNQNLSSESSVETFRTYRPGDLNRSWTISSSDIIELVNYVFKGQPLDVPECAGRCNGDLTVTSTDIIWLVNAVFKAGPEPIGGCS